jgi:hypothetical protein
MKPTHKITIGNEVFEAVKELDGCVINRVWFGIEELKALNAKVEGTVPFRFEDAVEWVNADGAGVRPIGMADNWWELIGKRGRLIFTEEV